MKRKINGYLIGMSVAVAIVAAICFSFIFYGLFQRQIQNDLSQSAEMLRDTGIFARTDDDTYTDTVIPGQAEINLGNLSDLRITWVDEDGHVLYDNDSDASSLENHQDRPEIEQALTYGEGKSIRRSATMGKDTIYYALRLDDGTVLRLSTDVDGISRIFLSALPVIILIILIIILVSAFAARMLTRQLLKPIEEISQDMENAEDSYVYEELVPFVDTIREQHDNILSAAKVRQDFTANVSHELKTPLTAISGYAELIENHMADPEQEAAFAEQIKANADRLLSLIDDIIRLSELDGSSVSDMTFEETDLYEIAKNRVELLKISADKKHITISLEGESTPVQGNRQMIAELIDNLCQNAVKYNSENGTVRVRVQKEGGRPVLTVSDNGIGIPKDMQERVFERFFRVDKSRSKETGGTGLGLSIVKHIVELHDAEIVLESDVGEGTTVKVIF